MVDFSKGDVVVLKSGGPPMTVEEVDERDSDDLVLVYCTWLDSKGQRQQDRFDAETLEPGN